VSLDRPRRHFTPRTGWLNDPLALTWHDDRYHLFFQHVPDAPAWAAHCSWGRATSTDLLHWQEQPVALAPADDELGAWSGCLVDGTILYTSVLAGDVERGRLRLAHPVDDDWARWRPGEVVVTPPDDPEVTTFRDPFVVREGERWRMLVGAGLADGTGCALGYVSSDLTRWEYDGVVAARHPNQTDPVRTGSIWECPQLLRLPQADVLVVSPADSDGPGDVVAALGSFEDGRFEVTSWHRLTAGAPYAASTFTDRDGRPGLVAWLRGIAGEGWAGAVSTPFLLTIDDQRVGLVPHPSARSGGRAWDTAADCWEVEWDTDGDLRLLDEEHRVVARLSTEPGRLVLTSGGTEMSVEHAGGPVRLLRDGPVLEVLVDGRLVAAPVSPGPLRPAGSRWRGRRLG
jgi:beta-fructofuranosidase